MKELEIHLTPADYEAQISSNTAVIIDFMSYMRTQVINSETFQKFDDLISTIYKRSIMVCPNNFIQIIFDSYCTQSLKGPESRGESALELAQIDGKTPIPKQIDKFWCSSRNKVKLQEFAANKIMSLAKDCNKSTILSGVVMNDIEQVCRFVHDGQYNEIDSLKSDIEEADQRLIPHIQWSLHNCHKNIVVVSGDTDVLVLLLHYYKKFLALGIEKLWIRVGKKDKNLRFIPIHVLYTRIEPLCKVLLTAHIGTGCDYLSKIGTKHGAISAIPEMYLKRFNRGHTLSDNQIYEGQKYLVKVLKNSNDTNFDDLRCSVYRNNDYVFELPLTSHSIVKGHIPRWYFIVKELSNLLNPDYEHLNPLEYGWKLENEQLLPEKNLLLTPKNFSYTCSCKAADITKRCKNNRCKCKKSQSLCTEYFSCKKECTNKLVQS